ncbi:MAG: DUF4197 domain-containing protein, partial [Proteobacteria bacterium]|nr:DUF4197 domain-containing protein [Pseudomonadota bacterium]
MQTIVQKLLKNRPAILCTISISIYVLLFATQAQSGWWQKGTDLLKGSGTGQTQDTLTTGEIGAGLKDALLVGSENVVSQLGSLDGFNLDPAIHIPLPEQFSTVKSVLGKVGMTSLLDDLELKLNRAAEIATPRAKALFGQAISEMTFEDVMNIYNGPDDAATSYFQEKMSPPLATEMQPIVEQSLAEVGAVQAYDNVMGEYRTVPFVPDVKADLTTYVVEKGMDGIFYYMAREEAAIRQNPTKRTTELLQRVFG